MKNAEAKKSFLRLKRGCYCVIITLLFELLCIMQILFTEGADPGCARAGSLRRSVTLKATDSI